MDKDLLDLIFEAPLDRIVVERTCLHLQLDGVLNKMSRLLDKGTLKDAVALLQTEAEANEFIRDYVRFAVRGENALQRAKSQK